MKTSIFLKTWPGDAQWVPYCLRSIRKFANGFDEVVIAAPRGMEIEVTTEKVVPVMEPKGDGYLSQQNFKLYADIYTAGDYVLYIDSDTVLREPVTPESFISSDGRPKIWCSPWDKIDASARNAWFDVMKEVVGVEPERELMRRNVFTVKTWMLAAFRDFIHRRHKMSCQDFVMSRPNRAFSEFNCLNHWLWEYHHGEVDWIDESNGPLPRNPAFQSWSHGGLTPEIRKQLEEICA